MASDADDDGLSEFVRVRPRLFGIAYRMLGCASEAEDVMQEVWLRWQSTDRTTVRDAKAFLVTVATRVTINVLKSARSQRETYVGSWLPEPVDTSADPTLGAERSEALELAVLLLLEKLTPNERAAYVLREAFDTPHQLIAEMLHVSEANARQLVSRARKHINDERRAPVSRSERLRLLDAFVAASQRGDISALESIFASSSEVHADGGGLVRAAREPIVGRERIARFAAAIGPGFFTGVTLETIEANGQPAILVSHGGVVSTLITVDASPKGIERLMFQMRPSKLVALARTRNQS